MFMDSILSPAFCEVLPESFPIGTGEGEEESKDEKEKPEMETIVENIFSIMLCDNEGTPHYVSSTNVADLRARLPVTVIMNHSKRRLAAEFPRFNY
jgi:hypothetical protein